MKTLYVIRHAKSGWGALSTADFDRPLNERGMKDAPAMAQHLIQKKCSIDLFVSSPAKRAKTTCTLFCEQFHYPTEKIIFKDALYHAPEAVFVNTVKQLPNEAGSAAIFSHNPGITYFVNSLVPRVHIDNMPTCGVFAAQANCEQWQQFFDAECRFLFFDYPKNLS